MADTKGAHAVAPFARAAFLHNLLNGVSALALGAMGALGWMALAAPAYAQDAAAGAAEETDDEDVDDMIVVTGIRASMASAQAIKQNSDQFVDSITAVDIGRLPDVNVAETLQRISGVQISRSFGEGSGIAIRGLTQVRTELNGRDIFTANGGRGLSWEEVGSDLLAGVDVFKNPSAELIEGGLGGTIRLRTRMPFDTDGFLASATFGSTNYELIDDSGEFGSVLLSNRWDTGIGEIGALVNVSYGHTAYRRDQAVVEPFWERTDVPDFVGEDNIFVNAGGGIATSYGGRDRTSTAIALQWAPTQDLELYAQYLSADYHFDENGYSWFAFGPSGTGGTLNAVPGTFSFDDDGVLITGALLNPFVNNNTVGVDRDTTTTDYAVGAKWRARDNLTFSTDFQYIASDVAQENLILYTALTNGASLPPSSDYQFHMDLSGEIPRFSITPNGYADDPTNYYFQAIQEHRDLNEAESVAWRGDMIWDFDEDNFFRTFTAGVRYTDRTAINRSSSWGHWGFIGSCDSWANEDANCHRLSEFPDHAQRNPFQSSFLNGDGRDIVGPTWAWAFADAQDPAAAFAFVNSAPLNAGFTGFQDFSNGGTISDIDEQTLAGYAMLRFGSEIFGMEWDGNFGVRVVETESASAGVFTINYRDPDFVPDADPLTNDTPANLTISTPIVGESSYTHTLPSLNLRLHVTDELQLRFAASKNIARPDFGQLNATASISPTYTGGGQDITPEPLGTGSSSGNPDLSPMQVTQFDASIEWYFSDAGFVYGTIFRKDLTDLFFTQTQIETYTIPSLGALDFAVSRLVNLDEGELEGFEIGGQRFFDFLPSPFDGFGVQANYTYVDSNASTIAASDITGGASIDVPLQGLSEESYNLVLLYEKYGIAGRLAYNWRSDWVETTSGNGTGFLPIFARSYGQLDGSISYDFNEHAAITFDAVNILDERHRTYQGTPNRPRVYQADDRRFAIRLRLRN